MGAFHMVVVSIGESEYEHAEPILVDILRIAGVALQFESLRQSLASTRNVYPTLVDQSVAVTAR